MFHNFVTQFRDIKKKCYCKTCGLVCVTIYCAKNEITNDVLCIRHDILYTNIIINA